MLDIIWKCLPSLFWPKESIVLTFLKSSICSSSGLVNFSAGEKKIKNKNKMPALRTTTSPKRQWVFSDLRRDAGGNDLMLEQFHISQEDPGPPEEWVSSLTSMVPKSGYFILECRKKHTNIKYKLLKIKSQYTWSRLSDDYWFLSAVSWGCRWWATLSQDERERGKK